MADKPKITRKTHRRICAAKNRLRAARPALRLVASRNRRLRKRGAAVLPKRRAAKQMAKSRRKTYEIEQNRRKKLAAHLAAAGQAVH